MGSCEAGVEVSFLVICLLFLFLLSCMEPSAILQVDASLQLTQLELGSSEVQIMEAWCCVALFPS